mmetsp:Transcript_80102/g.179260  ORF Transcript_80102/g.179260 Transcript_80102/m.179260 type:complete len:184 (-) Transcript_80102:95-646(-)
MACDTEAYYKSPLRDFLPLSHPRAWNGDRKRIQLGKLHLKNPDNGTATLMADLRNPDLEIKGFQIECVTLYKNMSDSKVLKSKVTYDVNGEKKVVMCPTGYDEVLEAVCSCAYDLEPVYECEVFVRYGSWDPTANPGIYKLHRRPDYLKVIEDPDKVYREWVQEQNAARRAMEAKLGWDKLGN